MTYNMYSDNFGIYSDPEEYRNSKGHGRFDLPHAVIMLGYDFGKGWKLGMEIEFEHGGVEAAVERENEEAGEFEKEIERGGEVALEQFWIEKSFFPQLNVRAGHIIVPVGLTNTSHLPTQFFTVYRPEGENTIMPCTWHETGISVWGRAGDWRYEALMVAGLNSTLFSRLGARRLGISIRIQACKPDRRSIQNRQLFRQGTPHGIERIYRKQLP